MTLAFSPDINTFDFSCMGLREESLNAQNFQHDLQAATLQIKDNP